MSMSNTRFNNRAHVMRTGVQSSVIGAIRIADNFSMVEVPDELADEIIAAMRTASLRGKRVVVRRDRDTRRT